MPKVKVRLKRPSGDEVELRRWCIEQATRWPVTHGGGMMSTYVHEQEVDLIGRAERLLAWVTKTSE